MIILYVSTTLTESESDTMKQALNKHEVKLINNLAKMINKCKRRLCVDFNMTHEEIDKFCVEVKNERI